MDNDTIKLIRKTSNVNSLMVIIFYMLDIALIRLGDLAVYHIAGKSAYYEDIAQLVSYCIQYLVVVPIVLVVFRIVSGKKEGDEKINSFASPPLHFLFFLCFQQIKTGLEISVLSIILLRILSGRHV